MKRRLLCLLSVSAIFLFFSCHEEETKQIIPVRLQMKPHSSNNEFYAGIPVQFGVQLLNTTSGSPFTYSMAELYVNGDKVVAEFSKYAFAEPATYQIKAVVKTVNHNTFELDTVINIATAPPIFGSPQRGEKVLFGWKAGASYKMLLSTYHSSSVYDYEVLSIDEALKQQEPLVMLDLGWYPQMIDHNVSPSGKLALIYDNNLVIYNASLTLTNRTFFNYGNLPRKVLIKDNSAVLLFDSLANISLKKVDLNTGKIVKGPTQFIGVDGMKAYDHFFIDEFRTAIYYTSPNNSKTLLIGVNVGSKVEFSKYFLPPVLIENVTPLISGGYVINSYVSLEKPLTVLGVDKSSVVKWAQTFQLNYQSYWYQFQSNHIAVKELRGFIYVFFDNMRCVKLSLDGQLIWDKYFYSEIARFEDVFVTPNDEFIMTGTRQLRSNDPSKDGQLETDVICIKINTEGNRTKL
jgi:hypothetical protein